MAVLADTLRALWCVSGLLRIDVPGRLGNRIVWRRRSKVQVAGHLCRLWGTTLRDVDLESLMIIAHLRAKAAQNGIGHTCADRVGSKLGRYFVLQALRVHECHRSTSTQTPQ